MTKDMGPPGSGTPLPTPPLLPPADTADAEGDLIASARERVFEEAGRFRATIGALLFTYEGRWVVFRGGEVVSAHDTEEEAYVAGLNRFGAYGGHIVAEVRDPDAVFLDSVFVGR